MFWTVTPGSVPAFAATVAVLLVSAVNEELLFRGYPLQVLMKGIGVWPSVILLSALFGLLHAGNPDSSVFGVTNTVLAGILLSLAYLKTRSLWLPLGIHAGWNIGLGPILGFPVSGIDLASLWTTRVSGPGHLFGGDYGPEGGLIGTLVFTAGAAAVWGLRGIGVSPRLQALLRANAGKLYVKD
jgi:membrane protease YdiL (CAAX protease family)